MTVIKKIRTIIILLIILLFTLKNNLKSNPKINNSGTIDKSQQQAEQIIAHIDSLLKYNFFKTSITPYDTSIVNKYNFSKDSIPIYSDLVYECRMAELNKSTPMLLEYNKHVRRYIDVYTIQKREQVARMLGLAELYFPIFEQMLDKYELPLELKYLAIVESALNPLARSKSGAMGLWQFMYHTSQMFDLKITSYIDERCDPIKSTEAACKYLEYLYRIFNDWNLTLAAYNGGPGAVRNAIQRSGGITDFWKLRPYLSEETQDYVPAFYAATYIMNYSVEHNIHPVLPSITFKQTDTVLIKQPIFFNQIASVLNLSVDEIAFLNPQYKKYYIPCTNQNTNVLIIPANKVTAFLQYENDLYLYNQLCNPTPSVYTPGLTTNKVKIIHTVDRGEYFHKIAIKYGCTIDDIKVWNNISDENVSMGQQLIIYVTPESPFASNNETAQTSVSVNTQSKTIYYTIRKGDSLWSIANKFQCDSVNQLLEINNLSTNSVLYPGMVIKIKKK